ncbi:alpha-glucan family phosphorylase [Sulfuriflexus sp.]|uniref:alpha-glucan family phosphorylase n=1 Tax=Sulfuriflexus sp. TaxID=2015443 RepID=UPI0028CD16C4|nr:alpha-glucan family phosphorylase [Sulfuriflexus sp.]MDT8405497.1 alpha-glucan family phosphorylase [Sulfuriflexus sp.]
MNNDISIAYFSMEIALESSIPTYAGGLGILAGDTLRSAADSGISMAGVTLLSRKGYFQQNLNEDGQQYEAPVIWPVDDYLLPAGARAVVELEDRQVSMRAWRYDIRDYNGHVVPVFLLDTDVEGNSDYDRSLTDNLYGGDDYYRLCQEIILGIGGIRILRSLGNVNINRYHMNEGHSSLLVFELIDELKQQPGDEKTTAELLEEVKRQCVFTTHTPVAAGHDRFPMSLASRLLKQCIPFKECSDNLCCNGELNLTHVALETSYYINGVAEKHRETSRKLFEGYDIESITNGIHAGTWVSSSMGALLDKTIKDWRADNASLRYAISIADDDIWQAHQHAKRELVEYVNKVCNASMDQAAMTIGFARRATMYKRPTLLFTDTARLASIAAHCGPLQLIYAGKAHPRDTDGKDLIREIFKLKNKLGDDIRLAYIPDYDMATGKLMTSGVDLWLNTPLPPMEASGTSGMKAAINGVPSLSILDGWWIEGCIEGVTGWAVSDAIEQATEADSISRSEADILYSKLENIIMPMYYHNRSAYIEIMRNAIAINGSFFNTERMISQYVTKAYFR